MTTNISNIDELIKTQNPFAGHLVVKPQQIWGKVFLMYPQLMLMRLMQYLMRLKKSVKGSVQQ